MDVWNTIKRFNCILSWVRSSARLEGEKKSNEESLRINNLTSGIHTAFEMKRMRTIVYGVYLKNSQLNKTALSSK